MPWDDLQTEIHDIFSGMAMPTVPGIEGDTDGVGVMNGYHVHEQLSTTRLTTGANRGSLGEEGRRENKRKFERTAARKEAKAKWRREQCVRQCAVCAGLLGKPYTDPAERTGKKGRPKANLVDCTACKRTHHKNENGDFAFIFTPDSAA